MSQKKIPVKYVVNIEPVSRMNKTHNALWKWPKQGLGM
jgi:hypothetical protein